MSDDEKIELTKANYLEGLRQALAKFTVAPPPVRRVTAPQFIHMTIRFKNRRLADCARCGRAILEGEAIGVDMAHVRCPKDSVKREFSKVEVTNGSQSEEEDEADDGDA